MANIKPADLGKVLAEELTVYHKDVLERVNDLSKEAATELVKKTKATAPVASGDYKKHIASKLLNETRAGDQTYVWYVKPPDYRLSHLLAYGHLTSKGDRTKRNPFLENAVNEVLPDYEQKVEEAIRK